MNIHLSELIIILIVAIVVIKPERLPELMSVIAKIFKQIKNIKNQLILEFSQDKYSYFVTPSKDKKPEIPTDKCIP